MAATIPTTRSDFVSAAQRCAAWLTLPDGPGPHPAVVLAHGLGATHEMMLAQYEQRFATSGIATLAFDYLNTGASEGAPRQRFSIPRQCRDLHAALNHLRAHPDIDATRIGLWGTSLGGMNVLRVAAERADISAAVVQCPIVHGRAAARTLGAREPSCG
ncbi:alpha/beta fold hydrolase [Mycolicibacterium fortuitum]